MDLHLPPDMHITYQSRDNVSNLFHSNDSPHSFASPSPRPTPEFSRGAGLYSTGTPEAGLGGSPGSSPSAVNVVEPLVVDTLAKDFNLDQQQHANLHAFVKASYAIGIATSIAWHYGILG